MREYTEIFMKYAYKICIYAICYIGLIYSFGCGGSGSNDSGDSTDPIIVKYQDAQVDTPQAATLPSAYSPQVVMSNEAKSPRVFIVWLDQRMGEINVYFNCKTLGGAFIHANDLRIDTGMNQSSNAEEVYIAVSADGQIVHIVWSDRTPGKEAIWYNRSTNGGVSFSAQAVCLSPNWPFPYFSSQPRLCCSQDGSTVYVAYRYGHSDIAFRYSLDAGANWPPLTEDQFFTQVAFRGLNISKDPCITCDDAGNYCHIVWQGGYDSSYVCNATLYRCFSKGSTNWVTSNECDVFLLAAWHRRPQVVCTSDGATGYIACRLEGGAAVNELIMCTTTTFGAGFSDLEVVSDLATSSAFYPKMYCNRANDELCIVWEKFVDDTNDTWQVLARKRISGGWYSIKTLSNIATQNNKHYALPAIAGNGSNVVVAWVDFYSPPNQYIYANLSNDCGISWQNATGLPVSTPGTSSVFYVSNPQIAVNANNQSYMVWEEKRGSNAIRIYGRDLSTPGDEETICHSTATVPHGWQAKLAQYGSYVYSSWLSDRNGGQDIYYTYSSDYGNSWNKDFIVNQTAGKICQNLQLKADSNYVYVAWEQNRTASQDRTIDDDSAEIPGHRIGEPIKQIAFQRYEGNTRHLSMPKPVCIISDLPNEFKQDFKEPIVSRNSTEKRSPLVFERCTSLSNEHGERVNQRGERVDIGTDDNGGVPLLTHNNAGAVYLCYDNSEDNPTCRIRQYISRDYGITWNKKFHLYSSDYYELLNTQILAESGFLYLVTQMRTGANASIVFIRYSQYLETGFDVAVWVDNDEYYTANSQNPMISRDRNRLLIAWTEFRDGSKPDVYFNYSLDNGINWATAQTLSQDPLDWYAHGSVQLASSPEFFYAVWNQYNTSTGLYNVMFRRIYIDPNGNMTMTNKIQLNTTGNSVNPQITCDGTRICVAWYDDRYGKNDIYIRTSTDKGISWSGEQRFNTNSAGSSHCLNPQIATTNGWIYAIWEDYRSGHNVRFEARK